MAKSPYIAFQLKNKFINDQIQNDWDKVKLNIMEKLLYSKAQQHEDVREILLKTGNAIICENNPNDTYWGLGIDEKGENNLGKLWMKIRNKIQNR